MKQKVIFIYHKKYFSELHAVPAEYAKYFNAGHETLKLFCHGHEMEGRIRQLESHLSIMKAALKEAKLEFGEDIVHEQ